MTIKQIAVAYIQHQISLDEYKQLCKQQSLAVYLAGKVTKEQLKTACSAFDNTRA